MMLSVLAYRRTVICMVLAALSLSIAAQSFVHRYQNNTGDQYYYAIHPMSDGRIIVGGSATTVNDRAALTMLDAEGNVLWTRTYGGQSNIPWGVDDCVETADGNLLVLMNVTNAFYSYTNLVRVSAQTGQVLEAQRLGDNNTYAVYRSITRTIDGFLLSGAVGTTSALTGFSLMKTDFNGAILWQRAVGILPLRGELRDATVSEDGHIWAIAALEDNLGTVGRTGVFHFDPSGNLASYQYSSANPARKLQAISIAWQPGVGPLLGNYYYLDGPSSGRPLFIQLDTLGEIKWSKVLNTTPDAYITPFLRSLPDGNMLAVCGSGGAPNLGVVVKLDPTGSVLWTRDLTTNDGAEVVLTISTDSHGNLYGAGLGLAPLPMLERRGFVFKTDDPLFDTPSCCSRAINTQTFNEPTLREPLPAIPGDLANIIPITIPSFSNPVQRQDICSTEAAPQIVWSDTSACPGACATLRLVPSGTKVYTLSAPGALPATVQVSDSTTLCFPEEGTYNLLLEDGDCIRTHVFYTVRQRTPGPVVLSDTLICPGRCITASSSETDGQENYVWAFEGGQPETYQGLTPPEVCFNTAGSFAIRLNIAGCGFTADTLEVSSKPFQIPNAFTPNGDGSNDLFRPLLECPDGDYLFEVYNRWGQKVFSTTDPMAGWNGEYGDEAAPSDVYAWVLLFGEKNATGQSLSRTEKGQVSLLR